MNTCHGADRLVPVPADIDSLCRFNGDLPFRLQARQRFLDRPPGNTMFFDQFPDGIKLLTA